MTISELVFAEPLVGCTLTAMATAAIGALLGAAAVAGKWATKLQKTDEYYARHVGEQSLRHREQMDELRTRLAADTADVILAHRRQEAQWTRISSEQEQALSKAAHLLRPRRREVASGVQAFLESPYVKRAVTLFPPPVAEKPMRKLAAAIAREGARRATKRIKA